MPWSLNQRADGGSVTKTFIRFGVDLRDREMTPDSLAEFAIESVQKKSRAKRHKILNPKYRARGYYPAYLCYRDAVLDRFGAAKLTQAEKIILRLVREA
jgi:hypothetical protein